MMLNVIGIDVDGTALLYPEKVNKLFDNICNFIVLYTARPESSREQTVNELVVVGVKYHALVMGKLRVDKYIDDRNMGGLQWE